MLVYLLKITANIGQDYISKSWVHSSLKIAIEKGKNHLEKEITKLYNNYKIAEQDISLEQIVNLDKTNYEFTITELDPQKADMFENEIDYIKEEPTHKVYVFKYDGTLKYTKIIYKNKQEKDIYSVDMYQQDTEEEAGRKYKVGDIVTTTRQNIRKNIFVIKETPKIEKGQLYFDNTYLAVGIYEGGCILRKFKENELKDIGPETEIHRKIKVLQKIMKEEIKVSNDEWAKIKRRRNKFRRIYNLGDENRWEN